MAVVVLARLAQGQPLAVAGGGAGQKVQQAQVAAQHTLLAVGDERVEDAVAREQLLRVLLDPQP